MAGSGEARMGPSKRHHFTMKGKPKRSFASFEDAWKFRRESSGLKRKQAYVCLVCGFVHLGAGRRKGRR